MALLEKLGDFLLAAQPEAVAALKDFQLISSDLFYEAGYPAGSHRHQQVRLGLYLGLTPSL